MPTYNYLPGVIVNTLDGGLTATFAPQDNSILIIGTAGQGPVNTPYQVTDRALAAQTFGFSGSLERSIEECATNSDNIIAFRMGASPMVLTGVDDQVPPASRNIYLVRAGEGPRPVTPARSLLVWLAALWFFQPLNTVRNSALPVPHAKKNSVSVSYYVQGLLGQSGIRLTAQLASTA
jgi:hypothetical protein